MLWLLAIKGTGMIRLVLAVTAVSLASCDSDRSAPAANVASADSAAEGKVTAPRAAAAQMSLLNTTWEFSDNGKPTVITIDKAGDYIENRADGTHVGHGTYVQKGGKDCFTSAMGDKGTSCWTAVPEVDIGATASATSDGGQTAVFKRVAYRELKLPG
jgi:hypothetical protein